MSNRRKIRETVLQATYSSLVGDQSREHVLQTIIKPAIPDDAKGLAFAESLFLRTLDQRSRTDDIIRDHTSNWEIDRLAVVDHLILQMAITELLTFPDIPTKVTINEAIEIAKKYSTAKSGRFVNGILDAVLISVSEQNLLDKRGRGLVDQPARKSASRINLSEESPEDTSDDQTGTNDEISDINKKKRVRKQRIKRSDHKGR